MITDRIKLPYGFKCRDYQRNLWNTIYDREKKRAFTLWHRRAGKDVVLWNLILTEAIQKVGIYYYLMPTYTQAKKIIWDGITNDGKKFLDYIPKSLIKSQNGQEMKIELTNGSLIQLIGTDNYDAIRGTNPIGCVFSEYAFQNPMAWEVVKPILKLNGGWAVFNTTPNGKNHAYELYEMARHSEDWFCERLTIEDTGLLSRQDIQKEREEGMTEEMIQQEYYCSFDVGMLGSIYGEQIQQAWKDGRVCELPFFVEKPVDITFDLGISKRNETAAWFDQTVGEWIHFVNYFEASGRTFDYYCNYIDEYLLQKNGKLGMINIPHDSKKRDWVTGATAVQSFQERYGKEHVRVLEPGSPSDTGDFQKVRALFPKFKFDKENCKQGVRAVENYHYEYDAVKKIFRSVPLHDWASNGADSLRYRAVSFKENKNTASDEELNRLRAKVRTGYPGSRIREEKLTKNSLYISSK